MSEKTKTPRRGGGPMGGGPGNHMSEAPVEKAKDLKGSLAKLTKYLRPYWVKIIITLVFAIGSTIFTIIGPKKLGTVTEEIVSGLMGKQTGGAGIDFAAITGTIIFLAGIYLLSALFRYIQGFILAGVSQGVSYKLRDSISKKINKLPLSYFDKVEYGDVLSRVTNDVDTISTTLNQSLSQIVTSITSIVGVTVMMLTISGWLTLVAVLMLPISAVLIKLIVGKSQKYFVKRQKSLGEVSGHVEESYSGHNVIKIFGEEESERKKFNKINNRLYKYEWKSQFISGLMMPVVMFVGNLGYVGIAVFGGYLAAQGSISIGDVQAFFQYIRSFTQPVSQLATIANVLQSTAAASERVFEFVEEPEEEPDSLTPKYPKNITGAVQFKNVHFGYNPEETVINDFSLSVKPGEQIAIVGPTGAGKTTIVKLLMRFYELGSGSISVDGVNINEMSRHDLRAMFGMVLQDTWLFDGTVKENISYSKLDATDEKIKVASKTALAHHFIRTLPGAYDMELGEDVSGISEGQIQLLTIARAVLADCPILILDEATSSVDTRTEQLIQRAMDRLMKGRTTFVIAHRLSTIKNADRILVLKDGDIIETGTHKSLMVQNGFYSELYNSQFDIQEDAV